LLGCLPYRDRAWLRRARFPCATFVINRADVRARALLVVVNDVLPRQLRPSLLGTASAGWTTFSSIAASTISWSHGHPNRRAVLISTWLRDYRRGTGLMRTTAANPRQELMMRYRDRPAADDIHRRIGSLPHHSLRPRSSNERDGPELAGVVFRGVEGFGASQRVHTTHMLTVRGLPIAIVIVDAAERIEAPPQLDELMTRAVTSTTSKSFVRRTRNLMLLALAVAAAAGSCCRALPARQFVGHRV